ncbi:MAG TPA: response regulator [Gemmatimonadales bacterium]|nr:response regulator [Gemmatimonadales bacterium]
MQAHILVVEDSATQAEALRLLLEEHRYKVTVAPDGEHALALVGKNKVDLVLSDITMPGISGYELCRRIKTELKRRDLPVVLLSSLADPMDIVHGLEAGADNYISKPYEPDQLLLRIRHVLESQHRRRGTKSQLGLNVTVLGSTFTITSEKEQILDLLISTFEDAVQQNKQLRRREEELEAARAELARYAGGLEERLRSVVATVPDVLFSLSPDGGQVHYISPAAAHVFGYTPEEVAAERDLWYQRLSPEDVAKVRACRERAAATGQSQTVEYRFRRRDDAVRWIETSFIPVRGERGTVLRLDGISRDITEQRKLEEQFRQAQKMEAVGRLAGGVAHDFNNLLTVITSYSDILLEDLAPHDPRRADMEEIRKAAISAAGLTRQLLAFSRQQVLEPRVLNLNAVVTNTEKLLRRLLGEDVQLVTAPAPQLGAVKADPGQLEQVIVNLAVNARDAMPEGGKLTIETANAVMDEAYVRDHPLAKPGPYVMLAVSDTGAGMDEQTQRRIFEPFFTTKEPGKGTGLGLATVYGIVKQSGGFIWVYSEPGHGTTFKIYLPRVAEPVETVTPPAALGESLRGSETVLLAEDAAAVRAVTRQVLDRLGYTVLEAPNGAAALHLATKHHGPIHLLLTDVIMPELGGRQLAQQLIALRPELRVLYASGYTDDAVVRHGVLTPGVAYLQKPFTPDVLARKVREVLDSPHGADPSQVRPA